MVKQGILSFPMEVILDETNFLLWSQLMEMCIGARQKVGNLIGEAKKPDKLTRILQYGLQ